MADFAREQLKRFGWVEGKGLGKNENGISTALKPKLKFDTYGVGHKPGEQFSFKWWDQVFNNAAKSFDFINSEKGVSVKRRNKSFEISTKKKVQKKEKVYVNFIKVGTLNDNTFTPCDGGGDKSEDEDFISKETDEDVFRKCKGRTAHNYFEIGLKNPKLVKLLLALLQLFFPC
ncbi:G patch domain-containing protein 4-like isoform X2 [Tachypleus tridentatus]|uniref:G patch domain-containing protein 4-like isoform X2 n=1 Tax=Tachypleus tridentatus TaxID=6853 RepID=UPI003FD22CE9